MGFEVYALLFVAAFAAGCFDAIAGGGGLVTLPAILLAGLDPVSAVATNKVAASGASLSATWAYARRGLVDWRSALPIGIIAGVSAIVGALSVHLLSKSTLDAAVPIILIAIALYFALSRRMTDDDRKARLPRAAVMASAIPFIGFYDGFFGPGAGSFYMVTFVGLLGYGVMRATAHTKVANAASNVGALGLFMTTGGIHWVIGLVMAVGAFAGAQVGSRLAIRMGARLIRPLLVIICCGMAIKLLLNPANPVSQWFGSLWSGA